MSIEKLREEFETVWGYSNDEQNLYFIPELNTYGSAVVNQAAGHKSTAWLYFQRGWKAYSASLVIELPPEPSIPEDPEEAIDDSHMDAYHSAIGMRNACAKSIEAAGVKCK